MIIVNTVGTGALVPAEEGDASSIVKELARTIVGSRAALARLDIKATTGMDKDSLDVRGTLREEVGSTNMATASN
jgi:hypothetical protein